MSVFARADELGAPGRSVSGALAATLWTSAQLLPSPLLVVGGNGVGGGVRWQVTPLLYSFGVAEKPIRFFYIEPVARHSGAVELYGSPEWTCCAASGQSGWLARAGARLYLPVVGRGESASMSVGGSYAYENRRHGIAAELGLYTLSSMVGITATLAPRMTGRELIFALTLHYL